MAQSDWSGEFRSCWSDGVEGQRYPRLERSLHTDVVVVGAGIVGLSTALQLSKAGREVILVEAMRVGRQVTGGSTAKVTAQHGLIYAHLIETLGIDKARLYADANRAGIRQIHDWITTLDIDCGLEPKPAYAYSCSDDAIPDFEAEAEAAQLFGFDATLLDRAPLPFDTSVALQFPDQAQFNPIRYLDGLAAAFVASGGRIFEGSRVRHVGEASRWRVVTDGGNVHAEHVVVATNLTIKSPVGMSRGTQPRMHVAMAFRAKEGLVDGMFLGIDEPTHSLRMGRDAQGPILVALGPKFDTGHEVDVTRRFEDLEAWVRRHLTVGDAAWRWCNEDYDTPDRVAYVGEPDAAKAPGFHIATGFNAWGISNGTAAAMLIAEQIVERANPWEALYDPTRPAPEEFNRGGDSVSMVANVEAIAPGEGGVIQRGEEKVAIWKAPDGSIHELSAACTHKGCTVSWNNAAKTWDCPCHGSMFARDGSVLHGPARSNLKQFGG